MCRDGGKHDRCVRKEVGGDRAPLHHPTGVAPPASHFLHGSVGPNPDVSTQHPVM